MVSTLESRPAGAEGQGPRRQEGVTEIELLLSAGQLARLDEVARQQRMSAAALVRRLIYDFLTRTGPPPQRR